MDKETKITYITISILILLLGSLAFYLQNDTSVSVVEEKKITKTVPSKKIDTPSLVNGTTTLSATSTEATTTMETKQPITRATITTNKGVIEVSFSTNTPLTVANFTKLAREKFYNGVRFHRVIKDFMIQTGDPLSKDPANQAMWGTGGPGYKFQDELTGNEQYALGTLAMANSGPNTNGSQFFIVTANPGYPLPPNYTVFGKVTKGIEVALKIGDVKTGTQDRPLEDIIIESVSVE